MSTNHVPSRLQAETNPDIKHAGCESADAAESPSHIVGETRAKRHWKSHIWDTLDKPPKERRFLFKLDAALLTFASLGYFIKYLDQININNAFVSGMKEDLGLDGNQLNYMQTCWTVGYVIGEIPRQDANTIPDALALHVKPCLADAPPAISS